MPGSNFRGSYGIGLDPPLSGWERKSRAAFGYSHGAAGGPSALGFQRDRGGKEEGLFCRGPGGDDWKLWDDGEDIQGRDRLDAEVSRMTLDSKRSLEVSSIFSNTEGLNFVSMAVDEETEIRSD